MATELRANCNSKAFCSARSRNLNIICAVPAFFKLLAAWHMDYILVSILKISNSKLYIKIVLVLDLFNGTTL